MKKAVVLGMILLAIGGMAFADGSTVGMGFGRTQFDLAYSTGVSGTNIQQGYGWFGFPQVQRFSLDFAWSNDHTAVNIDAYLGQPSTTLTWVNVYGTLKLVPDMVKVMIGKIEGDGFDAYRVDSAHPIHDVNNGNVGRMQGWGAIVDIAPKDSGFEASVFAKYSVADPTFPPAGIGSSADTDAANMVTNYEFAASYTVPSIVKIAVGSTKEGVVWPAPGRDIFVNAWILAVPNLSGYISVKDMGFDAPGTPTNISAELAASYNMNPLTIIFAADFSSFSVGSTTKWAVYPEVIYNMGMLSLGLYAGVAGGSANSTIAYEIEPYVKLNDFGLRVSFDYVGSTASGAVSSWAIPVLIDWGF